MDNYVLRTKDISIDFNGFKAVNNISLQFEKGKFTTILGPNGAGKTTFFNLLSGMLPPTNGSVFLNGTEITNMTPQQRIELGLGRSFQITNIFPRLTIRENIRLAVQSAMKVGLKSFLDYRGLNEVEDKTTEVLEVVLLGDKGHLKANELTHGEQRKLELGMVLALKPQIILLDEPTAGMSVEEVPQMIQLLKEIKKTGSTIVLIEHKINMVKELSDELIIIVNGELLVQGHPEEVTKDPVVMEAYLGGGVINVDS